VNWRRWRAVAARTLWRRLLVVAGCVLVLVLVLSVRSCGRGGIDMPPFEARAGGAVWALGRDCQGQLGDGPAHDAGPEDCSARDEVLVEVEGIDDAVMVRTMGRSVFAVRGDGTVWAWGANDRGQLGDGTTTDRDAPVRVPGLSQVVDLTTWDDIGEAGVGAVYAVRADGTVWAWSARSQDEADDEVDDKTGDPSVPRQVEGVSGVTQVSPGRSGVFGALRADGTVMRYGCPKPTTVAGLSDIVQIGTGWGLGDVAVGQDGTVWTWDQDCADPAPARQVPDLTGVTRLGHDVALHRDGTLWRLPYDEKDSPVQVTGLTDVVTIDSRGDSDTYAVRGDGSVWTMSLGSRPPRWPQLVYSLPAATHATASAEAIFVIEGEDSPGRGTIPAGPPHSPVPGPVVSWLPGQVADENGQTVRDLVAVPTDIDRVVSLAASGQRDPGTVCALLDDSTVMAWGANDYGELGNGFTDSDPHPDPAPIEGMTGLVSLPNTFGALGSDGQVWRWGGEHRPAVVAGIDGVTKVAGFYALRQDGTVWQWSWRDDPVLAVPGLTDVVDIVAQGVVVAALRADGTVWTWDDFEAGVTATQVPQVTGVTGLVGADGKWAFVTVRDGTVWAVPMQGNSQAAVAIAGLTDVAKVVAVRDRYYYALRTDGQLWVFTHSGDGLDHLGPGPVTSSLPPVADLAVAGNRVYAIVNP